MIIVHWNHSSNRWEAKDTKTGNAIGLAIPRENELSQPLAISSSENEAYVIYKCPSRSGTFTITKTPGGSLQVKNGCVPAGF